MATYRGKVKPEEWVRLVRVTRDERKRVNLVRGLAEMLSMTRADMEAESRAMLRFSVDLINEWGEHVNAAIRLYGNHGPLISGVYRDHFPHDTKERLRALAHGSSAASEASSRLWLAAGRRIQTWREMRDRAERAG